VKHLWKIAISLFNETNLETSTEWGWKLEAKTLYLNFQGSSNFRDSKGKLMLDWKQNFDFLQTPYKNMPKNFRVHRGFLKKWKSVRDAVTEVVDKSEFSRIVITGFSQGSALATLCHEELVFRGFDPETFAFGSPRVFGWGVPKDRFKRLTRITYSGDIITGLAPWIFGYSHVGNEKSFGKWPKWFRVRPDVHMKFFKYLGV